MEARATMKYVRTTPRKMRRVVDLIRGQHVAEARRILRFSPLGASHDVEKLLNSAVANAEQQPGVIAENLVVARAWVDEGPTLRRYRPRAYGRATRVRKRTSHVTVVVRDDGRRGLVGHKVHPYGFRLGVIYPWKSNWYADSATTPTQLHEDIWIRKHIRIAADRAPASPRSTSSARATRSGCSSARPAPAS